MIRRAQKQGRQALRATASRQSGGHGTRTRNSCQGAPHFQSDATCPDSPRKTHVSDSAGADAGAVETKTAHDDGDLQAIIDAWPTLPDAIRAGILAMVKAAGGSAEG